MLLDPIALGQFEEVGFTQSPRDREIDLVEGDGTREMGLLEPPVESLIQSPLMFLFDQQSKAFIETEVMIGRGLTLGLPCLQKTEESQVFELVNGGLHDFIG
jgi:hypothetical protein